MYHVPREFLQLSAKAAESRNRTEALYSSAEVLEPLPIKLLVGNGRHCDSTSCVQESTPGTHGDRDVTDLSTPQGHVTGVSSRADAATVSYSDVVNGSNGDDNHPAMISGSSECTSTINGEVKRLNNAYEHMLTSSRCEHLSDGSPTQNGDIASQNDDLVLIAAGHEIAMGQQKQCKDDESNRCKQQMNGCSNGIATTSPVKQQANVRGCSTHNLSVSSTHKKQTNCFRNSTLSFACNNLDSKADECCMVNQSASDDVGNHLNDTQHQPRHNSSSAAVGRANSTYQTETDECHIVRSSTSSSFSVQSDCDVPPHPSAPIHNCDTTAFPHCDDAVSVGSPSYSDTSDGGTVGHSDLAHNNAVQRRRSSGIGRGQILRMMLSESQH